MLPNRNPLNINKQESIPVGCVQSAFVVPGSGERGEGLGYPGEWGGSVYPPTPRKDMGPGTRKELGTRDYCIECSDRLHTRVTVRVTADYNEFRYEHLVATSR